VVWSQWRRWRDKGTWAAAMRVLAREIRLRNSRKADPTMVMVDGQTVKGGRAGPTFHEAGGRGGHTRGAKRTILIEILGLPLAVFVESAKPYDVQSARKSSRCSSTRGTLRCPASGRSSPTGATAGSRRWPRATTSTSTSRSARAADPAAQDARREAQEGQAGLHAAPSPL